MNDIVERLQRVLGDAYRIERELGGGGMSRLFVAVEQSLNRQVVVKVLPPELTSEVTTARFKREFEVTALLQHPHILPVLAAGARDGLLYYVMPYVAGESLRHRLEREGQLAVSDTVRILGEMADALAYAHERGVVHRDIKPENILLTGQHALLADFGIARGALMNHGPTEIQQGLGANEIHHGPTEARLTDMGMAMGTPGYMSPEQAAGEQNLDARSDIYALAVVGYEMLSGHPPFEGPTRRAVLLAHLSEPPRPLGELREDIPAPLADALMRALAKSPDARFQTAIEFRDAILGASAGGARAAQRRPRRISAGWLAAAGLAVAVALGGGAMIYARGSAPATLDDNLVAIAPFDVLDPALAVWEEGIVDVLSANLDGAGPLRTVSPTVVIRRWSGRPDPASAQELGRRTGARLTIFGRLVKAGNDSVRLTATLFDVGRKRALGEIELRDAGSRMDRLTDSLTMRVLRELNGTQANGAVRAAAIGSSSLPAIKAYLQGEQYFRRSDFDSAAVYFQRAVGADSMFAPALRRLSNAMTWHRRTGENNALAYGYSLLAGQRNHGLAARESLLVVADSLFGALALKKDGTTSPLPIAQRLFGVLDTAARRFPDDPEVWFKLGDARFHYHFFTQRESFATARQAFDRSIALDPAFAPAYIHPIDLAIRAQDDAGVRRYVREYLALEPHDVYATSVRFLARLLDSPDGSIPVERLVTSESPEVTATVWHGLLHWMDSSETAVRLGRAIYDHREGMAIPPEMKAYIVSGLVASLAYRGHLSEALALSDSTTLNLLPQLALLGAVPDSTMRPLLGRWLTGTEAKHAGLGLRWWAERGDTASTARVVRRRAANEKMDFSIEVARGYHALARRDTAEALRQLDAMPDSVCSWTCWEARLTRGQLLAARHRDQDAARVLGDDYPNPLPMRVVWMLERARVAERLGNKPVAIEGYAFVARAWRKADPELQPVVAEARAALRRLGEAG